MLRLWPLNPNRSQSPNLNRSQSQSPNLRHARQPATKSRWLPSQRDLPTNGRQPRADCALRRGGLLPAPAMPLRTRKATPQSILGNTSAAVVMEIWC
jgi:hypothetical protein